MRFLKSYLLSGAIAGSLALVSCQKEVRDTETAVTQPVTDSVTTSEADRIKDTVLAYSKDIYLWYQQIPENFNARQYGDPDEIMTAIRQFSIEPGFNEPVDKWSFAVKQQEWDKVSSGNAQDFGLNIFFRNASDLRVKHVEEASPAGQAGIRRGWRITKINGNSSINTDNIDFVVDNVFNSNSTVFTFEKPDNTTVDITLEAGAYQENPIVLDSIYNIDNKKIGYFSFNSFLGDTSAMYNAFDRIFTNFAAQQVNDVIVDLRYNGGGYVSVQQKLANYLAPTAANGQLMMKQEFNDKYADDYNSSSNFRKLGSLNLSRLFFIVSKNSASASELLINNLKPFLDVQLIGPSKTYGKPVGFFPIPVSDWYILPVSFRTTNNKGEGNYFGGMALNSQVADGLDKDWGDVNESSLASAIRYITIGNFTPSAGRSVISESEDVKTGNHELSKPAFKGTIDVRRLQ